MLNAMVPMPRLQIQKHSSKSRSNCSLVRSRGEYTPWRIWQWGDTGTVLAVLGLLCAELELYVMIL